jgi:hypothetical protein
MVGNISNAKHRQTKEPLNLFFVDLCSFVICLFYVQGLAGLSFITKWIQFQNLFILFITFREKSYHYCPS